MLEWLKNINKEYPEFWKNYISKFEKRTSRFVVISTETSGLNPSKDVILSIGALGVENNSIVVQDYFEMVLLQYKYLHDNGISSDFLLESEQPKMSEWQAMEKFIEYIGNSTLVGHRINFDVEMINEVLEKMACGRLKNEALDLEIMHKKLNDINNANFTIEQLGTLYKIPKTDRISTTDDAYTLSLLFLKLKSRLNIV
jgi:DNA polymerase-3 subunit epsilon